ncbi:hypothetical protein VSR34_22735 [Paraburkholderia sp. JHI2823]|uniref:hypothetical protein n=1 Tax=Paraburkholderia TaxID=1822464 RepID=UPI000483CBBF|nr:hypothetical protein [Paraburkholderia mimosarum]
MVHLANTTAIKKYDGLKHSGDETDARYLAHLLRLAILPTGAILPPQQRAVRAAVLALLLVASLVGEAEK